MMKTRNIENKLAYAGALIVLIGVLFAATSAFAAEPADVAATTMTERDGTDETIVGARKAITEAAVEAAESLKSENTIELDIQLTDLTSTLIVASK
jgi:hypothetical protein